ncbi:SDR family oxidoreductase [Solihabitans fulvus]|uniref:SDR family oxidoreductase n=1 Tax=Solihabitans fulvus TaxID=1892852 RepID=UPI0016621968|nr:SDR family oxidoreductase [Solihabitans fulvus]
MSTDTISKTLAGSHVVVIGGSTGIGRAVAAQAVAAGAAVTVGSRSAAKLAALRAELGEGVSTRTVDVTDEADVAAFFSPVEDLDHLVVCPGDMANGSVYDLPMADILACLNTKIVGQFLCVRHAGRKLAPNGSITLLAGASGYKAYAGMSITGAANVGIGGLGRALAVELAPIRVNVVVAGMVDTPLWDGIPAEAREQLFEQVAAATPVGRIGQPDDIAATVLHLLGNTFVSGSVIHVDGGAIL